MTNKFHPKIMATTNRTEAQIKSEKKLRQNQIRIHIQFRTDRAEDKELWEFLLSQVENRSELPSFIKEALTDLMQKNGKDRPK